MTNYEKLIQAGPMELAKLVVLSKVRTAEAICERLGIPFEYSADEDILEHYEHLMKEYEE